MEDLVCLICKQPLKNTFDYLCPGCRAEQTAYAEGKAIAEELGLEV